MFCEMRLKVSVMECDLKPLARMPPPLLFFRFLSSGREYSRVFFFTSLLPAIRISVLVLTTIRHLTIAKELDSETPHDRLLSVKSV